MNFNGKHILLQSTLSEVKGIKACRCRLKILNTFIVLSSVIPLNVNYGTRLINKT